MARLTIAEQNWYRDNLTTLSTTASNYVINRVNQIAQLNTKNNKLNIAQIRNDTIDTISATASVYGDSAKALTVELFDYIMEQENNPARADILENDYDDDWIDSEIRYYAEELKKNNVDIFSGLCGAYIDYLVRRSAFHNLIQNAKRHKVYYARIPTGAKTCAFCMLLASRGFVYHSAESAGDDFYKYHRNCDCLVVPSTDGKIGVDGYDLDYYEKLYNQAWERAIEGYDWESGTAELTGKILQELRKILRDLEN